MSTVKASYFPFLAVIKRTRSQLLAQVSTAETMLKPPPLSKRIFDKYDSNKSGKISSSEFHSLCYDMGYYLSDKEREMAIMQIDTSGDSEIAYDEFLKFWQNDKRFEKLQLDEEHLKRLEQIVQYFRHWDRGNKGILTKEQFRSCYADLVKNGATHKSFEECWADFDSDGSGNVSFNEFVAWFNTPRV